MDIRVTVHPHQTFISKCDPFNGLAQEILEFLEAGASVLAFKRGQLVYDSGSTSAGFYTGDVGPGETEHFFCGWR